MQTRPLPETPDARSPAGAEIRYLMEGTTGNMIHSTVPPGRVNRAPPWPGNAEATHIEGPWVPTAPVGPVSSGTAF
jgi:hypothetical protein